MTTFHKRKNVTVKRKEKESVQQKNEKTQGDEDRWEQKREDVLWDGGSWRSEGVEESEPQV